MFRFDKSYQPVLEHETEKVRKMKKKLAHTLAHYLKTMFNLLSDSVIFVISDDDDDTQKNKRRQKYERRMERQKLTPKQPKRKQRW